MKKGRIIFLNGVTSSGKTSIVDALQEREDIFFYVVAKTCFRKWSARSTCGGIIGSISAMSSS